MSNEVLTQYKRYRARNRRFISAMVLLLAVTGIVSLIIGSHRIGWQELWAIVQNEGTEMNRQILLNIRLPRMLAAVITGIILSLSGDIQCSSLRSLVRDCISGSRSRHYPVFRPLYDHQSICHYPFSLLRQSVGIGYHSDHHQGQTGLGRNDHPFVSDH